MSDNEEIEKRKSGDLEKEDVEGQLPTVTTKDHVTEDPLARIKLFWWMFVNTVATVMIVSSHSSNFDNDLRQLALPRTTPTIN